LRLLAGVAALALGATPALAQPTNNSDNQEPWRSPVQGAPTSKPHVTSSLEATGPAPQDAHQSRALAAAIFSRPAAAQRAADKASAANAPRITPADPKPEWLTDQGVRFGGEGVEVSRPF
jgi:hypothetical protein